MPPTTTYCGYWSQLNTPLNQSVVITDKLYIEDPTEDMHEASQSCSSVWTRIKKWSIVSLRRTGIDSVKCRKSLKILVPGVGVEPTRCVAPKDFKSFASTDSATRAC